MADVVPTEALVNLLKLAVGGDDSINVRLFKNDLHPGPDTVLGDFVQANFSGYAPQPAKPFTEPEVLLNGAVRRQSIDLSFEHDGGPTTNNVYGYYVTLEPSGGPQLLWAGRFEDAPVDFSSVDDGRDFTVEIRDTQEV